MTSLTREAFLRHTEQIEQNRTITVTAGKWGDVNLRTPSEAVRIQREFFLHEAHSKNSGVVNHYRIYRLIDWIVDEDGKPLFTEKDVPMLAGLPSNELDPLLLAIEVADAEAVKNAEGASNDTAESSDETPDSAESSLPANDSELTTLSYG